jgi:hypothetical protein
MLRDWRGVINFHVPREACPECSFAEWMEHSEIICPNCERAMAVTIFRPISAPLVLSGSLSESRVALYESFDAP